MQSKTSPGISQAATGRLGMSSVSQASTSVQGSNQVRVAYRYHLIRSPNNKFPDLIFVKYIINASTNLIISRQRVRRTSGHKLVNIICALIFYTAMQRILGVKKFSTTLKKLFDFLRNHALIGTDVKLYNFYDSMRFVSGVLPCLKMSPGNPSFAAVGGITCTDVRRFVFHLVDLLSVLY
jgi:hypothetical protein